MQSSLLSSSCEPPCVWATCAQVYDGAIAATLRPGWRNLGVRARCHLPERARLWYARGPGAVPVTIQVSARVAGTLASAPVATYRSERGYGTHAVLEQSRSPFRFRLGLGEPLRPRPLTP